MKLATRLSTWWPTIGYISGCNWIDEWQLPPWKANQNENRKKRTKKNSTQKATILFHAEYGTLVLAQLKHENAIENL